MGAIQSYHSAVEEFLDPYDNEGDSSDDSESEQTFTVDPGDISSDNDEKSSNTSVDSDTSSLSDSSKNEQTEGFIEVADPVNGLKRLTLDYVVNYDNSIIHTTSMSSAKRIIHGMVYENHVMHMLGHCKFYQEVDETPSMYKLTFFKIDSNILFNYPQLQGTYTAYKLPSV